MKLAATLLALLAAVPALVQGAPVEAPIRTNSAVRILAPHPHRRPENGTGNTLFANYYDPEDPLHPHVKMRLTMNGPALNLDNIPGVASIDCHSPSTVIVKLSPGASTPPLKSIGSGTHMLVNAKWACDGGSTPRAVWRVTVERPEVSGSTVTFHTGADRQLTEVVSHYHIKMGEPGSDHGSATQSLSKRKIHIHKSLQFSEQISQSSNPIASFGPVSVDCVDCGIEGQLGVYFELKGSIFGHPTILAGVNGQMDSSFVFRFKIQGEVGASKTFNLLALPLSPIGIPGIFAVGPQLDL
ncbi:hypothetical protein BDK51DRAFT_29087, partial [Blyttiomyces helicus]